MRYEEQIERVSLDLVIVRGMTPNLEPYCIELFGATAAVWNVILRKSSYRRKSMGSSSKQETGE